jgi:DNA-directed RNA polymerase subunit H (RpoH/RPB5)
MDVHSVECIIYDNIFKFIDVIEFKPVSDDGGEHIKKSKSDLIKTLQFYSYIKIKAIGGQGEIMYVLLISDSILVSKSLEFKKILNNIPEKEVQLVVISKEGLKTTVKKFLIRYAKKKLFIRNLLYAHFKVDVRENIMVPKHEICNAEETKQIMSDNKIERLAYFPKIKNSDPQVLWAGGKVGQLIKIIRTDTTGEVIYYRIIV